MLINLADISSKYEQILSLIGGKASGLGLIYGRQLPIPPTWVVTTELFAAFKKGLSDTKVNEPETLLDEAAGFIIAAIGQELNKLPGLKFAVRSSATIEDSAAQSFAGMFESVLNVLPEQLPTAIARVWFSGLGERVRAYSGGEADRSLVPVVWPEMAVVIQPMIDAAYSGVCFSRDPAPQDVRDAGRALVEMVSGAGEQLVQGEVTPLSLTGSFTELAGCLNRPWMRELGAAVSLLEQYTGSPVDVEFAVDRHGKLWILQQRPVTVIGESEILQLSGYRKAYKRKLCSLDIEFLIDGCSRYLAPYLEIQRDLTRWMVMTTNGSDGQQELWVYEQLDSSVVSRIAERISNEDGYMERLIRRYERQHRQILSWRSAAWADEDLPVRDRLADFFEYAVPLNAHYYAPMHIIEALSRLLLDKMRSLNPIEAEDDFFALTTSGVTTLGQIFAASCHTLKEEMLRELSGLPDEYLLLSQRWRQAVDELVANFGFLNCHLPYEAPYNSSEAYNFIREETSAKQDDDTCINRDNIASLERKYAVIPGGSRLLTLLRGWLNRRNQQMEYLYFVYAQARPLFQAVGEQLGMTVEEVWQADRTSLLQALAEVGAGRPGKLRKYNSGRLCLFHDGQKVVFRDDIRPVYDAPDRDGSQALRGRTVFGSGEVTGTVRVAFSPEEITGEDGLIVVTGMTTPDFVPVLMKKAIALITDEGGILCHAAIIAREIRLPCIVGAGVATEQLQDGTRVVLDLDRGEIRILH